MHIQNSLGVRNNTAQQRTWADTQNAPEYFLQRRRHDADAHVQYKSKFSGVLHSAGVPHKNKHVTGFTLCLRP